MDRDSQIKALEKKYGEYFHIELLRFYYNYIKFYKLKEDEPTTLLKFDFEDGSYSRTLEFIQQKAFEESELLKGKHQVDDKNFKI